MGYGGGAAADSAAGSAGRGGQAPHPAAADALLGDAREVAGRRERAHRVLGQTALGPPRGEHRADVGPERVHQHLVRCEHVRGPLRGVERLAVDEQDLGQRLLHVQHGPDLAGDLVLDVVALVEHQREVRPGCQAAAALHLGEDPEQLERVGGPDDQVVVGVEPRVEVERAEPAEPQQLRDDELDVRPRGVVAGVEAHHGPLPQRDHVRVRRAPVRDVRVVERRLEQLVLQHQPLLRPELRVDLGERLGDGVLPGADVVLARVVRAVREPDLQVARARRRHDLQALEVVVDRLAAHARVPGGQRPELVGLLLERVRVDRPELHALVLRVAAQGREVLDAVPRDVQGDGRGRAGVPVHLGGVGDLLLDRPRRARGREHPEPGAGVAERPGRQLDVGAAEDVQDVGGDGSGFHGVLRSGERALSP